MFRSLHKKTQGFTIIEVLIVLAIAALIMLIIFLAVPALQRSSRNTQRKNDVAAISSAIANFISNNGGALPTADGTISTDAASLALYCQGATPSTAGTVITTKQSISFAASSCSSSNNNYEQAKLGFYAPSDGLVFFANAPNGFAAGKVGSESATSISTNSVTIDLGHGCTSDDTNVSPTVNNRTAAILSVTETGSGFGSLECTEQ